MQTKLLSYLAAIAAVAILGGFMFLGDKSAAEDNDLANRVTAEYQAIDPTKIAKATFGGGCFWCTEAVFEMTEGVHGAVSGYAGGTVINPTYEAVCGGATGHAEVIQVSYDPEVISYKNLLEIFFRTHDPTTLNQQGADVGTQYRSVVFFHDEEQQATADEVKAALNESGAFDDPIVTEISPLETFYPAEAYHQDYFANNPTQGYCRAVIVPKLLKYREAFADKVKTGN